jgi:hypothetical protein
LDGTEDILYFNSKRACPKKTTTSIFGRSKRLKEKTIEKPASQSMHSVKNIPLLKAGYFFFLKLKVNAMFIQYKQFTKRG